MKKWFIICFAAFFILMFLSELLINYEELGSRQHTMEKWKWALPIQYFDRGIIYRKEEP